MSTRMGATGRSGTAAWIVSGAVGGLLLGVGLLFIQLALPRDPIRWSCGVVVSAGCLAPPIAAGGAGLLLGGLLGRRVPWMPRGARMALGASFGLLIGAAAGGMLFLLIEVTVEDWPSGLAAFVTGSVASGLAGLLVGGGLGYRSRSS